MADDIAALGIRIDSLQADLAADRLKNLTKTGNAAEKQANSLGAAWGKAFKTIGTGVAALGTAAVVQSTRAWLEYDKAIKEVNSITGQTKEEFAHFRQEVLDVATALGVDATTAAKGLYEALSAGVPKENAIAFLGVASKTAVAGVTSVATSVNALTNVFNAFKIPVTEAEDVANKFLQTVNDGKTTFEQMSHNISDASVPMAAIGGTYEELFAQIGAITSLGTPTSAAFTQVKASINALLNPSEELLTLYKQFGVESGRAAVAQFGYAGTLDKIRAAYDGNDMALVKALRSSEAFNGVLSTTGENAETVRKFYDNLKNSTGNLADAYKTNADTFQIALVQVKTAAVSLVETLEGSLGVIASFSEALRGAAILIKEIGEISSNTDFSGATNQALNSASLGGANAAVSLKNRIEELEQLQKILQVKSSQGDILTGRGEANGGSGNGNFWTSGNGLVSRSLDRTTKEIETLRAAYDRLGLSAQKSGELVQSLADNANNPKALELAQQNLEIDQEAENLMLLSQTRQAEFAETKKKQTEENAKAVQKQYEADTKAAEMQKDADEDRLKLSKQLGENRRQIIEGQIKELELVKLTNGAKEQDVAYAEAGIAKLKEELNLLDEKGEKILRAKEVSGDLGSKTSAAASDISSRFRQDLTPIFELPTQNLFDQLAREEEEVNRSYTRRKQEILEITDATESEKAALIYEAQRQLGQAQEHFERERMKATLSTTADFFENISTIAGAAGKRGHKIAQAAAIAQTTIKTYESATSAYASLAGIPYIGPVLGATAAAAAVAAGLANIAKIKSTEYSGAFAQGGIVGGNSFTGDRLTASVNSGELILNRSQQKNLFDMANGKGQSSQSTGGNVSIVVTNLPGQQIEEVGRSDDGKIIELAVTRTLSLLSKQAAQGGGNVFPAYSKAHGLTRKGN